MWLLSVLVPTYKVIIDRCVNAPGLGRIRIDGINGSDKTSLNEKMYMIVTEESNNESMKMNAAPMICGNSKEFEFKVVLKNASSCVHMAIGKLV